MGKRSSTVLDNFEVDVVSLLRGQVDAIVHELAVAISDIQSGFPEEEAEDYLYGQLENLLTAMREQSARLREQYQRELKRHLRNEQELAKLRAQKRERERQMKE
jgi:ABC-type amino acid transport substrate-binding protein